MADRLAFPKSLADFSRMFPDEVTAFHYFCQSRWPGKDGFTCAKCGGHKAWTYPDTQVIVCSSCRAKTSATAGTALHRSKLPIRSWLLAAWLVTTDKRGISSIQLATQLGVSQGTAYMVLHKLRAAMVAPERTPMDGYVEVDEAFIGGEERGRGPEAVEKIPIVGAVEIRTYQDGDETKTRPARIRLRHLVPRSKENFLAFVVENVADGSVVVTDGASAYRDVRLIGYRHEIESAAHGMAQRDVLRHFHLVVSNLKTYLAGTYHGAVTPKHVQAYLNEYTFRFNRRRSPQAAFQTLLGIASRVEAPEYDEIYADEGEEGGWEHPNPPRRTRR